MDAERVAHAKDRAGLQENVNALQVTKARSEERIKALEGNLHMSTAKHDALDAKVPALEATIKSLENQLRGQGQSQELEMARQKDSIRKLRKIAKKAIEDRRLSIADKDRMVETIVKLEADLAIARAEQLRVGYARTHASSCSASFSAIDNEDHRSRRQKPSSSALKSPIKTGGGKSMSLHTIELGHELSECSGCVILNVDVALGADSFDADSLSEDLSDDNESTLGLVLEQRRNKEQERRNYHQAVTSEQTSLSRQGKEWERRAGLSVSNMQRA